MRICQLQNLFLSIFIVSFFAGCSSAKKTVEPPREERKIAAGWLKIPFRFTHLDNNDQYLTHPFFDVDPAVNRTQRSVNYFITIPEESFYKYDFDLYSGRLFKTRDYCAVDDIWDVYKADVYKPNFTQGIVPRTYDENQKPMRIVTFSRDGEIEKFKLAPTNYDTARIVGSIILDSCENYPCDLKEKWTSTQILIGVNPRDSAYSGVNLLSELRSKVDWVYAKAMLVNQEGIHQVGKRYFPAYRISRELNLNETFNYFEKKSTFANGAQLVKFREECFKLYDDVWEKSEKIRAEKHDQQSKFLNYFKDFYKTSSDQFYQCQKLVRPANINENDRRLWFFTFLQAFVNLEKNGFYYSCNDKAWAYNAKVDDTHYFNDQQKELNRCRARDFEKVFDQAINGLSVMRNQINKEYRFIEYDTQHGGSHQKIYGWVEQKNHAYVCKDKKSQPKENQFDVFPQDVAWVNYTPDEERTIQ
ncbi:MAG: hypothetical protein WC635_01155 [Bacteriovorax sp.]|jgi:hypothetical protein